MADLESEAQRLIDDLQFSLDAARTAAQALRDKLYLVDAENDRLRVGYDRRGRELDDQHQQICTLLDHHAKDRDRPARTAEMSRLFINSDHPCCLPIGDVAQILGELDDWKRALYEIRTVWGPGKHMTVSEFTHEVERRVWRRQEPQTLGEAIEHKHTFTPEYPGSLRGTCSCGVVLEPVEYEPPEERP